MSDLRIHAALSPRVAVLSSPDVDRVVQLNGLADLSTLLRPFEASATKLSVHTSLLETRVCDQFPLRFDPYSLYNPQASQTLTGAPAAAVVRPSSVGRTQEDVLDLVNQLISVNIKAWDAAVPRTELTDEEEEEEIEKDTSSSTGKADTDVLEKPTQPVQSMDELTPWFAAVQDLVLRQRYISRHETFGHPVCVLVAVSSASPDPMNDFARLYEIVSQPSPFPAHPYLNPDTLKYYVLLHDVRTSGPDLSGSMDILEQIKKTYGLHCCLLPINSAPEDRDAPEPDLAALWAETLPTSPVSPRIASTGEKSTAGIANCIDAEDVKRIKGFIRELTAQSVIPFMERYVQHMGEHLANSRKGLTNRLFGASRKLFGVGAALGSGSGKGSGANASAVSSGAGYNAQYDFYQYNTIEAQTRRLADFAFTIRDYKLAASMYDLGRKDYAGDKATRHAAGATEMFGLSHLLIMYTSRSAPIDVDSYLAQACHEYSLRSNDALSGGRNNENSTLRATLLYYEAYRALNYLRPAPAGLLRIAQISDEVLSPLLLEQAAIACLHQRPKPAMRKHAIYLVMAAHRYQACGQKILSLRCYAQAARVYRKRGWTLIENHIEHELGTQAYNEGDSNLATQHLLKLVRPSANSSVEHDAFMKALQTAYKYSGDESKHESTTTPLRLPQSLVNAHHSALRLVPDVSTSAGGLINDATWRSLEDQFVERGLEDRVLADGSIRKRKRPTSSVQTQTREIPVHQTMWLDLVFQNPLGIELAISHVCPSFRAANDAGKEAPQILDDQDVEVEQPDCIVLAPWEVRMLTIAVKIHVEIPRAHVWAVAFRLSDSIPCLDVLVKKGKRLNATQEQKRSVVYAPDTTLAVSVHRPRPTLAVRVVNPPMSLMSGETRRITIVLKNEGASAIEDIRALCDHPSAACFQPSNPTSTVMPNHLIASGPESLLLDSNGAIAPGQEVEVQATLRATSPGPMQLAWLISFSSSDDKETHLSRLALSTRVEPGLHVLAHCTPCSGTDCEYDLTVEATNLSGRSTVHVDAMSFVSPSWIVQQPVKKLTAVRILPLQSWRQKLRFVPSLDGEGEQRDLYSHTVTKLQDLLLSKDVKRPIAPPVNLKRSSVALSAEKSVIENTSLFREARRQWRTKMLAAEFPTVAGRDRLETFTLYEASDLDLMLDFHTETASNSHGQVQVYGLQPGPMRNRLRAITNPSSADSAASGIRSMYAQTAKEIASLLTNVLTCRLATDENPIQVQAKAHKHADEYEIEFTLRNMSDLYTARIEIQLTEDSAAGDESLWLGRNTLRSTIQPGTAQVIKTARLSRASSYNHALHYTVLVECCLASKDELDEQVVCRFVEQQ